MSKDKEQEKTNKEKFKVIQNDNYKEEPPEPTGWRKAAEVFNKSKSDRTAEDMKKELKKIRSEYWNDKE